MRKLLLIVISFLSLLSCEEVVDWTLEPTPQERLVVDGILTDELKKQEIRLSGLMTDINGDPFGITGANILISGDDGSYSFQEVIDSPGLYRSHAPFAIRAAKTYTLHIDWNGTAFEAESQGVSSLPMRDFNIARYEQTDSVIIQGLGVEYSPVEQAMYEFVIDWSSVEPMGKNKGKLVHYVFSSINIGQLFGPDKDRLIFPEQSLVIVRKYALDDGFAEYLRSLVVETQWKGGFFEETNGNLPTNISNGGLGYFAVCTVQTDTLMAR
jgi:hypothetical protein